MGDTAHGAAVARWPVSLFTICKEKNAMKTKGLLVAASLGTIAWAGAAAAAPTTEPKYNCPINHPVLEGEALSAMPSYDCQTIYVMPPTRTSATVSNVQPNLNVNFCPGLLAVKETTTNAFESYNIVSGHIVDMLESFDPLNEDLEATRETLRQASYRKKLADANFNDATKRKNELTAELAAAKSDYDLCKILAMDPVVECATELDIYKKAHNDLKTYLASTYQPAQVEYNSANAAYTMAFDDFTSLTTNITEALTPLIALQRELLELNEELYDMYVDYGRLPAFTAQMTYSVRWGDAVKAYQTANPGRTVLRLPISSTRLSTSASIDPAAPIETPVVLAISIPGVTSLIAATPGKPMPPLGSGSPPASYENVFGDSIGAIITPSLIGACGYFPQGLSGGLQGDVNELTSHVSFNLNYQYEVEARRGYTAKYNMSKWLLRVESKVKSAGFFSSNVLHDIYQSQSSSDWFDISFDAHSAEFQYTPEEQAQIAQETKGQLQERALELLAAQVGVMPDGPPPSPVLAPTGLGATGYYLKGACGFWSWCYVSGWVLSSFGNFFGHSEAVSAFHKNNSATVNEHVEGVAILKRTGSLTLARSSSDDLPAGRAPGRRAGAWRRVRPWHRARRHAGLKPFAKDFGAKTMRSSIMSFRTRPFVMTALTLCLLAFGVSLYATKRQGAGARMTAPPETQGETASVPNAITTAWTPPDTEGLSSRSPSAAGESFDDVVAQIEAMTDEELKAEIERLQTELERTNAVARLADGEASDDERRTLGVTLQRLALMRHAVVKTRIEALGEKAKVYQREHADLLARYRGPRAD